MKKTAILIASLAVLTLWGCNNEQRQITKAAEGYLKATGNYRIEEAYPYATRETREVTLPYMSEVLIPATDSAYLAANVPATIVLDSLLIENDTAWVAYTKTTPIKKLSNIIYLVKEDGKWLVDVVIDTSNSFAPLLRI